MNQTFNGRKMNWHISICIGAKQCIRIPLDQKSKSIFCKVIMHTTHLRRCVTHHLKKIWLWPISPLYIMLSRKNLAVLSSSSYCSGHFFYLIRGGQQAGKSFLQNFIHRSRERKLHGILNLKVLFIETTTTCRYYY